MSYRHTDDYRANKEALGEKEATEAKILEEKTKEEIEETFGEETTDYQEEIQEKYKSRFI